MMTETYKINVVSGMEVYIAQQPQEVYACADKWGYKITTLIAELEGQANEYTWYREGKPLIRYNLNGDTVSINDKEIYYIEIIKRDTIVGNSDTNYLSYYDVFRTDSPNLSFGYPKFSDAGKYKLQIVYTNCRGERDTMFTDEVHLFVFGETNIISQTSNVYAFKGGFINLSVNTLTSGATSTAPITYQWYRHKNGSTTKLENNSRFLGTTSSMLSIIPVQDSDINDQNTDDYYYCVVQGLCDTVAKISEPITVKTAPEISISSHPTGAIKCKGDNITFTVNATSS
jgi:hypothetical protein